MDHTALTKLSEATVCVNVPLDTLEPHPTVDQSVSSPLTVLHNWPAWSTSARTLVWVGVVSGHCARSSDTIPYVPVLWVMMETHSTSAPRSQSQSDLHLNQWPQIHVSPHHVDLTQDVNLLERDQCVHVSLGTEALLLDVDLNVLLMMNAADNWHVQTKSASLLVMEHVASMLTALLETISQYANVHLVMKEIHSDNATKYQKLSQTQKLLIPATQVPVDPMLNVQLLTEELPANV